MSKTIEEMDKILLKVFPIELLIKKAISVTIIQRENGEENIDMIVNSINNQGEDLGQENLVFAAREYSKKSYIDFSNFI